MVRHRPQMSTMLAVILAVSDYQSFGDGP
jgi:hypothetical protein